MRYLCEICGLGVSSIRLRTDNPRTYVGLSGFGIEIAAVEPLLDV